MTIVWCLAVLMAAWQCGRVACRLLGRWKHPDDHGFSEWPLVTALGFGVLSLLVFLVGVVGVYPLAARMGVAGLAALALRSVFLSRPDWKTGLAQAWPPGLMGLLLAAGLGLMAYASFGPQTGDDPLVYHLWCPQEYVRHHRIISTPDNIQCYGTGAMSMLYLLGLLLRGEHTASLTAVAVAATVLMLLYSEGRRYAGPRSAGWAVTLLATAPVFLEGANNAKAEAGTVLMCLGAAACWLRSLEAETADLPWFSLGCIFAGLGLTFKIQAAYATAPMLMWTLWQDRRAGWQKMFARGALAMVIMGGCLLPWAIRNFMATGDPLFPVLSRWLASTPELRLAADEWRMHSLSVGPGLKAGWLANLLLPITMTFRDERMGGQLFGWLGLGLWPLLAMGARRHRAASLGLVTGLGAFALWYLTTRRARYLLPAFSVGLLGLAPVLEDVARRGRESLVSLACGLTVVGNLWALTRSDVMRVPPVSVALGREDGRAWAGRRDPLFRAVQRLEAVLPPGARVMVLGDERVKYLTERDVIVHSPFQRSPFWNDLAAAVSADDLAVRLKHRGVTHVMMDESRVDVIFRVNRALQIPQEQRAVFDKFWRGCVEVVQEGTWVIVRIAP